MSNWFTDRWDDLTGVTASNDALEYQEEGTDAARLAVQEANANAIAASQGYGDQSLSALSGANANALSSMQQGYDNSQGYLTNGLSQLESSMNPYMSAGTNALSQQQALSGASGAEAQQAAYDSIQNSPMFQASVQQGNDAILQNAAATGGVRGGNTQGVLAQYAPQMLADAVNQQYSQLSGLSEMGYGASSQYGQGALGVGQTQASMANQLGLNQANLQNQLGLNQSNIYSNLGNLEAGILSGQGASEANLDLGLAEAQAGNAMANYGLQADAWGNIIGFGLDAASLYAGGGGLSGLSGLSGGGGSTGILSGGASSGNLA